MNTKNWFVKIVIILVLLSIISACSPQGTTMSPQEVESMLIAKEQQKWDLFGQGNIATASKLYADDFINLGFTPAGMVRQNKQEAFDMLAQVPPMPGGVSLTDFLVVHGDDQSAVVSYKVAAPFGNLFVSSVWVERNGEWKTIFYQASPDSPSAPPAATDFPDSDLVVTFAGGTCNLSGPSKLASSKVTVILNVTDNDKEGYSAGFVTLPSGKTMDDLIAASQGPNAPRPDWANSNLLAVAGPTSVSTNTMSVVNGPIYMVCFSWNDSLNQPRTLIGYAGPIEVGE